MELNFLILGPLEVRSAGRNVDVGGRRQRKLLGFFLVNVGRAVSLEQLVDELWEAPPTSARQQIRNAVAGLRRTLAGISAEFHIVTTAIGYRFDVPRQSVDLHEFQQRIADAERARGARQPVSAIEYLTSALDLWRGKALAGLEGASVANVAVNLEEQRLAAIDTVMALRLETGQFESVIGELRELVAKHPFRDSLRAHLMTALYRTGRQAEALAVFDDGRRRMADELGLDPGAKLRRAHEEILRDPEGPRLDVAAEADAGETAVSRPLTPEIARCFLPRDIGDFVGRSSELVQLLAEARQESPSAVVISAIDGMGGVGKTSLAVRFAHEVAADYPDGQYFVDLHGFTHDMAPISPAQALESLLRDGGVPMELVPPGTEGRLALWRAHMAGKRALVILDNVADAAQARSLLPGTPGILVVITSRRKLTALDGALPLSLDVLPGDDAAALFTQIVGERRVAGAAGQVDAVVELCGRLPLAIRIAAARLRDRQGWTVSDLLDRLRDQARRGRLLTAGDRNVMTVLKVSYRYLPPEQQTLFRLLGLCPGADIDAYAAAALADIDHDDAEDMLEAFLDDNLLRQDVRGRYYFHDLIRECAGQLCDEYDSVAMQEVALRRLADYYLHSAHLWCSDIVGDLGRPEPEVDRIPRWTRTADSRDAALGLLNGERANIAAVVLSAADRGWYRHAWQLAYAVEPYLRLRNYDGNSRKLLESALRSARAVGDLRGEAVCLRCMVKVCRQRGSIGEALEYLDEAIELGKKMEDPLEEAARLCELGTLCVNSDRLDDGYQAFLRAKVVSDSVKHVGLRAAIVNNLGVVCRDMGKFDQALSFLHESLELEPDEATRDALRTRWNIAMVLHLKGEHGAAARMFEQLLGRGVDADFSYIEALAHLGLASVRRAVGDLANAVDHGRQAVALARTWDLRKIECEALCVIGEAALARGDLDRADQVFTQAREYSQNYEFPRYTARAWEGLAHAAWRNGALDAARQRWQRALDLYPNEMVDVEYVRRHLAAPSNPDVTCLRCAVAMR
jgi:DNA-binding SARP family transcriptional activator/tetratricopeptide (TPR) repeat protein